MIGESFRGGFLSAKKPDLLPMQIPTERAFWMLDFYSQHKTRLQFGGKLRGEQATCSGRVTQVSPERRSITVRLFGEDGGASWDRMIPLGGASRYSLDQLGEPFFAQHAEIPWHSVLQVAFPDGTILFFAETIQ
jgi:hypothetical protein